MPTPSTQGSGLGDTCSERVFQVSLLVASTGPNRLQIGSPSGLLCWLYSMATDVGLSQREGVPRTLPTDGPSWGHSPQRMLGGKAQMVSQQHPLPGDPADGGPEKLSSEVKAGH